MKLERAIASLLEIEPVLRQHGAKAVHVFGSRTRGTHSDDSDLDVFIDYDPDSGFSVIDLARLGRLMSEHTGLRVDIITRDSIKPFLRREIEGSAQRVF